MITIAALIRAQEGKADRIEEEFRKMTVEVQNNEPGNLKYIVHRSIDDPNRFFVYEIYKDEEAIKAHTSTPHFKTLFTTINPLMDGEPDVGHYQEIA
jgi:autoinducer 2-degrading protein